MNGHLVFWDHKLLEFDMLSQKVNNMWEFPGDLVVRILGIHCHCSGSIPGQGTEIGQTAVVHPKKKKSKQYVILLGVTHFPPKNLC